MTKRPLPTPATLRKLLRYDPETGKLFWRTRPVEMFGNNKQPAKWRWQSWNARFSGQEAFTTDKDGYKMGAIFNVKHRTHRVIWALVHGKWPKDEIDHINHNRSDNRIENLRSVSGHENKKNQSLGSRNTSGFIGVTWASNISKWRARVWVVGVPKHIGVFENKEDAVMAREDFAILNGFHKNHGRTVSWQ